MKLPRFIDMKKIVIHEIRSQDHHDAEVDLDHASLSDTIAPQADIDAAIANACGMVGTLNNAGATITRVEGTYGSMGWHQGGDYRGKHVTVDVYHNKHGDCRCHVYENISHTGCNYSSCDCWTPWKKKFIQYNS